MVVFSQKELQEDPGVYSITVISHASLESDYTLDIQQAPVSPAALQLHKEDAAALKKARHCAICMHLRTFMFVIVHSDSDMRSIVIVDSHNPSAKRTCNTERKLGFLPS